MVENIINKSQKSNWLMTITTCIISIGLFFAGYKYYDVKTREKYR